MLGAIIGDIIGAPYEFDWNNIKTTEFPLFSAKSEPTDDSVMAVAIALGFMDFLKEYKKIDESNEQIAKNCLIKRVKQLGNEFPNAGYGGRFRYWLFSDETRPYRSYGNGSAMRVSSAAWLFNSLEEVEYSAKISAEITHNHPEGIKGAKAVAAAIYLARTGSSKEQIKKYIADKYEYDLSLKCDDIRPTYHMDETCQGTIPQAFAAFFEGNSFEEVIRLGVSLGGDSDTLCAIAGSMAEAFYGIPEFIKNEGLKIVKNTELYKYFVSFEYLDK